MDQIEAVNIHQSARHLFGDGFAECERRHVARQLVHFVEQRRVHQFCHQHSCVGHMIPSNPKILLENNKHE